MEKTVKEEQQEFRRSLPSADELIRVARNIEAIRAEVLKDDHFPFYHYKAEGNVRVLTYDDGGGNGFDLVTAPEGSIFIGSDHEADFGPYDSRFCSEGETGCEEGMKNQLREMYKGMPTSLVPLVDYGSFCLQDDFLNTTVALWRTADDTEWKFSDTVVPDDEYNEDGLHYFVSPLVADFEDFLEDFYSDADIDEEVIVESGVNIEQLRKIFNRPLADN